MSEDLKIEVTECFVASILNEGKISQDIKSKLPREIAKRILKDKNAQKIILNAFLKLYPFVTGEISRYRRQSSQEKGNKALQEVPQMVYVKSENQFLINYRLIQEQVVSLKDMLANETLKHENTATKSINEIQKNETFHNERIIALLTDLSKYAPTTNPELQEISNDAWQKHMEVERLLKEEMRKHQVKFDTVDSKYVYKMNWLKEKAGIKINRLEKHISENFEKNRLDLDRVKMTLEDEYSTQREENAKEAADVLGYVDEDDIKDPEMVLKKYKEISAVKKILVKKLAHAEQFVNTLDLKLRNHVRSNKELSQQNKSFTNNMKMLNYCFLMLVERSRLIGDHKEKCRSLISEENYDVLEQLFNNNELLDSPLQEFLIKRLYDVRESLNILSLSTNEEATRMRVSKLISEIKVESMLTENEKERYDRFLNWQQVLQEKMQFERKPKSKSNIQSKSPNRFRRETKNTRRHADKETSVGAQSDYVLTNATPNLSVSKNQNYLQINSYMPKTTLIHTNLSSPRGPDALERAYKEIDEEMKSSTLPLKYNSKESFGNVLKSVDMEEANSVPLESPSTFYTERPSNPQSDFLNTERHELEKETTESSESDKSQEEEEEDPVLPSTSKIKRHDYHPNSFEGKLISSLYAPLLLKNKLPRKFDFKDFLALEINEGQRVKELIISALHNTVAKKENKHSQTEIDLDTIKNHRISQKEQVLREINEGKYRPEREKKKSLEQLFQVQSLTKYYTAKKELDDGKYSLDKEILKRAVYAAGKYEIQYDKESQRIGAMPEGEESDRIWEMVITKRVNDRRKDLVTNYLCNFLGTDMFAAKANEMIQLLKHHNIYKLTHTIQTFKPLQNQSFKRWSRLMLGLFRQQAKSIGRKVEEHNTTDVMEVWFRMSKFIKYVKPKPQRILPNKVVMTPVLSFEPIREKRSRSPLLRVIKRSVSPFSRSFLVSMTPPPQGVAKTPKFKSKFYTERVLNPRKSEEEDTYLRDGLSARGLQILPHI